MDDITPKSRPSVQVGQRFGRGVVIDPEVRISVPPRRDGTRQNATERGVRLVCDCGNEYVKRIYYLIGKYWKATSCGCGTPELKADCLAKGREAQRGQKPHNFTDRTGQRYGMLVAVRLTDPPPGRDGAFWLCRCDCGNETTVKSGSLRVGGTRSCGCQKNRIQLPPGIAGRNRVLKAYRTGARTRGFSWDLTIKDFDRLTALDCFYCGSPPATVETHATTPFTYNGLDRVNSDFGYTLDNVVTCCQICNRAKSDLPCDAFAAWLVRVTAHQRSIAVLAAKGAA